MPICQVKRSKNGDVDRVLAPNGKESLAYARILEKVNELGDIKSLGERFSSWQGRHISTRIDNREMALALYKQLYSPAFKEWMGNWSRLAEVSQSDPGNGYLIDQLRKSVRINLLDENGEPKDEALDRVVEGPSKGTFMQAKTGTTPSAASHETLKKVDEFLNRIGVKVEDVKDIMVGGVKLKGVTAVADALNALIQVTYGNRDIALPEEAMHMAVHLIKQKNPALFKEMMNKIGNYKILDNVIRDYKGNKFYQTTDGKPDIPKLKEEAIGKLLANTLVQANENTWENPAFMVQARNWWEKILDFLKSLFGKAGFNPFEETAKQILEGTDDLGNIRDISDHPGGVFLQKEAELIDKIRTNDRNTSHVEGKFEVNGNKVRNSAMEKATEKLREVFGRFANVKEFNERIKEAREEAEPKLEQDMKDILGRYINDDGTRRVEEEPHENPSALNPFDNTMYNTLENNIKERLDTYPAGTKFFKYVNLYDNRTNTAGRADLMAIMPDGKIDVLQFKMPSLIATSTDVPRILQELYNLEIEELRTILQNGYGVRRGDFRLTRAIPIRPLYTLQDPGAAFSGYQVSEVRIGNVNAKLITDDSLLPIPSASESTGSDRFDKFLNRLRGLARKMATEKVAPNKRSEKTARITSLLASIRKLQVQKKADQILSSGALIVKRQQEKFTRLSESIDKTDPKVASLAELNKIASEVLDEKDQVEIYSDLYRVFKEIFTDGNEDDKEVLQKARIVADDAQEAVDNYWKLSVKFRTQKLAAKYGIRDEFSPEKNLTWYRRMVRSLSQSSIKAGAILWELVSHINNKYHIDFDDRLDHLKGIEDRVKEWMKGRDVNELYKKLLQIDKNGKWNGKFIQRFSKDFFSQLREHQEKGNRKWVLDNIDTEAYKKWYNEKHKEVLENNIGARLHEDDQENTRRIQQNIQGFEDTFDIDKTGGAGVANYRLKDFPLEKWESEEFVDLKKVPALLELYNYWRERLDESLEAGMIEEHNGWSWFPNVRKNRIEKLFAGDAKGLFSFQGDGGDEGPVNIDPVTGKPIDEIHASYVADLGKLAKTTDGNFFMDYSEKSMDIFKVMALWDREIVRFKLKVESEGLARMLAYTEAGQDRDNQKGALATTRTGKLAVDDQGRSVVISNDINARYLKEHIDSVYYSKGSANESDVSIEIPVKASVEKINKMFGKEILNPDQIKSVTISGTKGLEILNRWFLTKTLGLNAFTAAANIFGGTMNTYINQGKYFNKMDVSESEMEMVSGRFYKDEESKKMAGLLSYYHPFLEDSTNEDIRKMSVSNAVKWLSGDHLFAMQRGSDRWVNQVIAMSYIKNTMIKDGKLVNIREQAKKELGHSSKYAGSKQDAKEFDRKLEDRVKELKKSPDALLNQAKIVNDHIEIPGLDRNSDTNLEFRAQILEFIKDALGNTSREDLSLYKRSIIMQSFFMFKNWIPRMLDVRGQSLKYNPGTQSYEWGRVRMLGRAVGTFLSGRVGGLIKELGAGHGSLTAIARNLYREKQETFAQQGEDFDMTEAEFIDMYIKGVRSELKEIALGIGLMGMLVAARSMQPPRDDDPEKKNIYRWGLRALDKFQDEITFFYNPKSFMDIVNGSTFPAVNLLVDIQRFVSTGFLKAYYEMLGEDQQASQEHVAKYVFRILPITKELMNWVAIFNTDFAREYGIKISGQNSSTR